MRKKRAMRQEAVEVPPSFAPVMAAFSKDPRVSCEKGWRSRNVILKVNGKIFALLSKGKLFAKLPKTRVNELVNQRAGHRFEPRGDGRLMKEWVIVNAGKDWIALATEARDFVNSQGCTD